MLTEVMPRETESVLDRVTRLAARTLRSLTDLEVLTTELRNELNKFLSKDVEMNLTIEEEVEREQRMKFLSRLSDIIPLLAQDRQNGTRDSIIAALSHIEETWTSTNWRVPFFELSRIVEKELLFEQSADLSSLVIIGRGQINPDVARCMSAVDPLEMRAHALETVRGCK
ncbi:MAG: hypothetical protein KDD42_02630 [Bdellovibrionales bacterium]|nr:hypothetical protein [Bdellovibrionales bacterium]